MNRFICIHAHFYQPPRENPWLEAVERQDSAYPYHDWDERITAECYAPNAASRILDNKSLISEIVNNYSRISFNFGPTLLSWMEHNEPETYCSIIDSDRESQKRFSGHGSAIAQAYNHAILPLTNSRDKYTQILWGIRDFERRFGRHPEGLWLPETAVDLETLDMLAELGITVVGDDVVSDLLQLSQFLCRHELPASPLLRPLERGRVVVRPDALKIRPSIGHPWHGPICRRPC